MTSRSINLRDISRLQRELTCLPFGIHDDDHVLLNRIHEDVSLRHRDSPNKNLVLYELETRYKDVTQNRAWLSRAHEIPLSHVKVRHELTPVVKHDDRYIQLLISDVLTPLHDSQMSHKLPPLCFTLSEDFKIWMAIEQLDERRCEDSELLLVVSYARAIMAERKASKQNQSLFQSQPVTNQ